MWNVVCFWLGFLELILLYLLKTEFGVWSVSIAIVDGFLGYIFAYLFYFVFVATANRRWQFWGFMTILAYASGTAYLTFEALTLSTSHVVLIEGLVNGCKALANFCVGYHALQIFSMLPSTRSSMVSIDQGGRTDALSPEQARPYASNIDGMGAMV